MEVEFGSTQMSIEQAFAIFLDPQKVTICLPQYLIYSKLMRFGYIVNKHDPQLDKQTYDLEVFKQEINMENEVTWNCLMEKLDQPVQKQITQKWPELYENTKQSMNQLCNKIRDQISVAEEQPLVGPDFWKTPNVSSKTLKKKVNDMKSQTELNCIKIYSQPGSFLDVLKVERSYQNFKDIFESISIVKKLHVDCDMEIDGADSFNFDFDVHLPDANYKKNRLPDYRLIVLR